MNTLLKTIRQHNATSEPRLVCGPYWFINVDTGHKM